MCNNIENTENQDEKYNEQSNALFSQGFLRPDDYLSTDSTLKSVEVDDNTGIEN